MRILTFLVTQQKDGIAVGVSWTSGYGAGLGTTIAIMMHEIPHELGDFVLYKLGSNIINSFLN